MAVGPLKVAPRIPRRHARELVLLLAKFSNNGMAAPRGPESVSDAEVASFFTQNGFDFDKIVGAARDPSFHVPLVENLIGSTWTGTDSSEASAVDRVTGEVVATVRGAGTISLSTYWTLFEACWESRRDAIQDASFTRFLSAISHGLASLEAFMTFRAELWNREHPNHALLDTREHPVPFETKIDDWVPRVAEGRRVVKSDRNWADFRNLKSIRDNEGIHPKKSAVASSYSDLAHNLNRMRTGIAGLLIDLHTATRVAIPAAVIRGRYSADVLVELATSA